MHSCFLLSWYIHFRSALHFGVIAPWISIGCVIFILFVVLCYDWRHKQICFKHQKGHIRINHQKRVSRSEPRDPSSRPESPKIIKNRNSVNNLRNSIKKPKAAPPPPPLVPPYLPPMRSQSQPAPVDRLLAPEIPPKPTNYRPDSGTSPKPEIAPKPYLFRPMSLDRPPHPPPPVPTSPPAQNFSSPIPDLSPRVENGTPARMKSPPIPNSSTQPVQNFSSLLPDLNPPVENGTPTRIKSPPPIVPYGTRPSLSEVAYLKNKFENLNSSNQ